MIERERFILYLQKLEKAYVSKIKFDQDLVDLWYEMFEGCEEEGFKMAVDKCIRENEFPPNIAGVMKCYKELENERQELGDLIKHQYTTIMSIWGENYDKDTHNAIIKYIFRFPKRTRKVEMVELTQRAVSYKHDCDMCGRKDIPTIKEYVEGKR